MCSLVLGSTHYLFGGCRFPPYFIAEQRAAVTFCPRMPVWYGARSRGKGLCARRCLRLPQQIPRRAQPAPKDAGKGWPSDGSPAFGGNWEEVMGWGYFSPANVPSDALKCTFTSKNLSADGALWCLRASLKCLRHHGGLCSKKAGIRASCAKEVSVTTGQICSIYNQPVIHLLKLNL